MSRLELVFSSRAGQTLLRKQFVTHPLKVLRPFDLAGGRILLQLINVGPGILARDNFELNIKLEAGAKVVLLNQSATKLHSMKHGEQASQRIEIDVDVGAELEYYPGLSIPYRNTYFEQSTRVNLKAGAKFAFLERWAMGRIAFGESFLFQKLSSRLRLYQETHLLYADGLELSQATARLGITDDFNYLAMGIWCWDQLPQATVKEPVINLSFEKDILLCETLGDTSAYMRALAKDGLALNQQTDKFVNSWREQADLGRLEFNRFLC